MSQSPLPPTVCFVARSGTGKTTLIESLIRELKRRGYRVGAIKHDAHRFQIDQPGKDSYRFTAAGADSMLISSGGKLALVKQQEQPYLLEDLIRAYCMDVDLVLVEGFKDSGQRKIAVWRQDSGTEKPAEKTLNGRDWLAVVTDTPLSVRLPQLDLNRPAQVADFLVAELRLKS